MQEYKPEDPKEGPAYEVLREQLLEKVKGQVQNQSQLEFFEVETVLGLEPVVLLKFSKPIKTLKMARGQAIQLTQMLSEATRKLPR